MAQADFIQAIYTGLASATQNVVELAEYRQKIKDHYSPKVASDKIRQIFSSALFASAEDFLKKNKNATASLEMIEGHLSQLPRGKKSIEVCASKACERFSKMHSTQTNWFTQLFECLPTPIQEDFFKKDPQTSNTVLQKWLEMQHLSRLPKASHTKTIQRL